MTYVIGFFDVRLDLVEIGMTANDHFDAELLLEEPRLSALRMRALMRKSSESLWPRRQRAYQLHLLEESPVYFW